MATPTFFFVECTDLADEPQRGWGLNCTVPASVSLPGEGETGFDDTRQVREMTGNKIFVN